MYRDYAPPPGAADMTLDQFPTSDTIASIARAANGDARRRANGFAPDPAGVLESPNTVGATLVVPVVVGTRPEAIKMLPVILELKRSTSFQPVVVSTGQHHRMVKEIFDLAGIEIETNLWAGAQRADLNERVATVIQRFNDFISERFGARPCDAEFEDAVLDGKYPGTVLVHGDTSSAMAAALAATHMHIPVMHIEAGLRTGGSILSPFPEELNRQVITTLAAMNFAPTFSNLQALIHENVPIDQIFVTGNTSIDALRWAAGISSRFEDERLHEIAESEAKIIVVTAHRRENWGEGLANIATAIDRLAKLRPEFHFIIPLHPNPRVREEFGEPLKDRPNVLLTEPLDYISFARLLHRCHMVITDSGGIQEEAPAFDKPVLVMRDTTERNEGISAGTLLLVGTDPESIVGGAQVLLTDENAYAQMAAAENPYGDGHAAPRIVAAMEQIVHGGPEPAPFGAGYNRRAVVEMSGFSIVTSAVEDALQRAQLDAPDPHDPEDWPVS